MSPKAKFHKLKPKPTKKQLKEVYEAIKKYCNATDSCLITNDYIEAQYELGLQFNELFFDAIKTLDNEFKIEYRVNKLGQIELLVMFQSLARFCLPIWYRNK